MRIDEFKGRLRGGGARANLFRCNVFFPAVVVQQGNAAESIQFLARSAQLPSSTIEVGEIPFRGRTIKIPGNRTFEEWTINVYNDTNFDIRNTFENWMDAINTHVGNVQRVPGDNVFSDLFQRATVDQLDGQGNVIKTYTFENLWPSTVGSIELSYDATTEIEAFDVTLQYSHWESDSTN
tara:strand:+ start:496 stop:1035 length:540 start_codon:yes stop_codon:yes gene_type:complete